MAASVPGVAPLAVVHERINGPEADPARRRNLASADALTPPRPLQRACSAHGSVERRVTTRPGLGRGYVGPEKSTRPMVEVEEARR